LEVDDDDSHEQASSLKAVLEKIKNELRQTERVALEQNELRQTGVVLEQIKNEFRQTEWKSHRTKLPIQRMGYSWSAHISFPKCVVPFFCQN
jgi:hypothetical protein